MDRYLEGAIEYDVDALCDGEHVFIAGIMEHIEEAGVHSGDSSCVIPPVALSPQTKKNDRGGDKQPRPGVIGVMNVQFAVMDEKLHVIETKQGVVQSVCVQSNRAAVSKNSNTVMSGRKVDGHAKFSPWKRIVLHQGTRLSMDAIDVDDVTLGPEMKALVKSWVLDDHLEKPMPRPSKAHRWHYHNQVGSFIFGEQDNMHCRTRRSNYSKDPNLCNSWDMQPWLILDSSHNGLQSRSGTPDIVDHVRMKNSTHD